MRTGRARFAACLRALLAQFSQFGRFRGRGAKSFPRSGACAADVRLPLDPGVTKMQHRLGEWAV